MPRKPSFIDRILGILQARSPQSIANEREYRKRWTGTPSTPSTPTIKPVKIPTEQTYDAIPSERISDFNAATATMQQLEWEVMNQNEPLEVRRAAAERWAHIAPKPLRPGIPYISGVGHDYFWQAFREAYPERERW